MENLENVTQPDPPLIPSPIPAGRFQELSLYVQKMPAGLFALVSLVVIFILFQIFGGLLTLVLFGTDLTEGNVTAFRLATMIGQFLFILLPTLFLARLRFPHVRNFFRFGSVNPKELLLVIVAVFTLQQLLQGYMVLQDSIPVQFPPLIQRVIDQVKEMMQQMYALLTSAHSIPEFIFVVIVIAATPAICEELLFRGLIQRTLEYEESTSLPEMNRRGFTAAVVAGVVFGLYHLNPFTLVPLVALGIYFGFIVYRTQNILTSMTAHFFNNFLACIAVYLNLRDDFLAIAPTGVPTTEVLAINYSVCGVVFFAATYYLVRATERPTTL